MKLSEAMRLGAMMRPQAFGVLINRDTGGTCAIGAVMDAVGILGQFGAHGRLQEVYPELTFQSVGGTINPITGAVYSRWQTIVDLNNYHKWTRERIADWIEQTFETPQSKEGGDVNEQQCDTGSAAAVDRDQETAGVAS